MARNLNFATLVPQHDTFTDTDGVGYDFMAEVEFGATHLAKMKRLQTRLSGLLEAVVQANDETAGTEFEQLTNESIALILPNLPAARIQAMSLGQKAKVVEFWKTEKSGEASPVGEAPAS